MILRCVCWSFVLCLALGQALKGQVTVDDQGYQNVLISFAPNVPSRDGKAIVEELKDILKSTSKVLNKAIGIPIASATFLLPPSWPTETWKDVTITPASSEQTARRSDIRLEFTDDSPFIKQPVSLQYGGCGVPGHQIILNLNFLGVFPDYPGGTVLAREWLKYRYGVFDENGFKGDPFYPDFYRINTKPEIRITDCTDSKIKYIFKEPISYDVCDMDAIGLFGYCRAYPDKKSAENVTSSLMYFHQDLPNMIHICGKDGRPHHSTSRNKQNALCNGRSIWDVVKLSDDFKNTENKPANPVPKPIQFSYIQESKPRFVVLLENSDNLHEKGKPVLFALRRLYYDLPPKSKLAIYTYNSGVTEALPYTELPAQEKSDLGVIADFGSPATSICTSCGLEKAVQTLLQKDEVDKGSIFLITASPLDKVPELSEKVKESGICLHVLRFTDGDNPADQTYDGLASSFHCFSQESLRISLDDVSIFNSLSRFLKNDAPQLNDDFEIKTVASGYMSAQTPVTIPQDSMAELYTLWLGRALGSNSIECKENNTIVELKPDKIATDIASFTFVFVSNDTDVTCRLSSAKQLPVLTQVQMKTLKGHYFDFDIWIHDASTDKEQFNVEPTNGANLEKVPINGSTDIPKTRFHGSTSETVQPITMFWYFSQPVNAKISLTDIALPILIYAKIYFGEYPIKEANVTTVVTSGNRKEVVTMLDNGRGDPDVTQYDGIYSGYFTNFLEKGDYEIRVEVDDNQGEAKIGKDSGSLVPNGCCGSEIKSGKADVPAFRMDKSTTYTAKNKRPEDGYPPSKILDLQARILRTSDRVLLTWTAPGGGKAVRYVMKLFESREDAVTKFETTGQELNVSIRVPGETGKNTGAIIPFEYLNEDSTYFAAVRSWNEFNKSSEISNVVEFVPKHEIEPSTTPSSTTVDGSPDDGGITKNDPTKKGNKTIAIVLGVLGGIAVLCILVFLGYYFFVKKPRRNQ